MLDGTKYTKSMLLFSSDQDGEVLAAVSAANRYLQKNNSSWFEIVEALNGGGSNSYGRGFEDGYREGYERAVEEYERKQEPDYRQMLSALMDKRDKLNAWSIDFIENLVAHPEYQLSYKQKRGKRERRCSTPKRRKPCGNHRKFWNQIVTFGLAGRQKKWRSAPRRGRSPSEFMALGLVPQR